MKNENKNKRNVELKNYQGSMVLISSSEMKFNYVCQSLSHSFIWLICSTQTHTYTHKGKCYTIFIHFMFTLYGEKIADEADDEVQWKSRKKNILSSDIIEELK